MIHLWHKSNLYHTNLQHLSFKVQSELQSKFSLNEQASAVSNILLKGFNNNNLASNNLNLCKNLGAFPGSSSSGIHNSSNANGNAFSNFASLGLNADHLQVTRPRMRICFDPETEIPRLQKWFSENNHPTRQQVETLCRASHSIFNCSLLFNYVNIYNHNNE